MAENGVRQWASDANLVKLLIVVVLALIGQIYLNINSTAEQTARDVSDIKTHLATMDPEIDTLKTGEMDLAKRMLTVEQNTNENSTRDSEIEKRLDNQKINQLEKRYHHERIAVTAEGIAHKRDLNDLHKQLIAADRAKAVQ
jgi:regulator of replication initiation timing